MNKEFYDVVSNFKNLREFQEFMNEAASGEQISRGMTNQMTPDSKEQKKAETYVSKEVKKNANGSATETHYDQAQEPEEVPEPPPQPVQPGMQVAIGRKEVKSQDDAKAVPIEMSGEKETVKLNPTMKVKHSRT